MSLLPTRGTPQIGKHSITRIFVLTELNTRIRNLNGTKGALLYYMVSKISRNLSGPHVKQILRHLWPPRELDEFTSWQRHITEAQITKLIFDAVFKVIRCCQEVSRIPGKSKTTPVSHWPDCLVSGLEEPEKPPRPYNLPRVGHVFYLPLEGRPRNISRADKYNKYRKSLNYIKYINCSYIIKYSIYSLDLKEFLNY